MMKQNNRNSFLSADVIEFVTLATRYCSFLEQSEVRSDSELYQLLLKMLGTLYLKALSLPLLDMDEEEDFEVYVTEEQYDDVRSRVSALLGAYDDYLDTFVEEMKYSDKPILKTISEDLADIYQVLGNFVHSYMEREEIVYGMLAHVVKSFTEYWGGRALSAMRALHELACNVQNEEQY